MRFLKIIMIVALLCVSGCLSNAADIAENSVRSSDGAEIVNASEGGSKTNAVCETKYNEKSGGRAHNIKLAASKLNGAVIAPGETFSYNGTLGPTGKANGYKKARIFVRGQDAEGYGGGVCQVSSALYNCALDLGLEISERHAHSKPVGYVAENRDAATSYGGKDFKFVNTLDKPLKITATAAEGVLNVSMGV